MEQECPRTIAILPLTSKMAYWTLSWVAGARHWAICGEGHISAEIGRRDSIQRQQSRCKRARAGRLKSEHISSRSSAARDSSLNHTFLCGTYQYSTKTPEQDTYHSVDRSTGGQQSSRQENRKARIEIPEGHGQHTSVELRRRR